MTFLYANRLKLCMRIDLMSAVRVVGETTSMYANRIRSCRRNDLDVCESTCMRIDLYANRLVCETTGFLRCDLDKKQRLEAGATVFGTNMVCHLPPRASQYRRGRRAFLHSRIPYVTTGICSFQLEKLSGDIHPNPGPPRNRAKYPCGECLRNVRNNQDAILYAKCVRWLHARCLGMSKHVFKYYLDNYNLDWECTSCSLLRFSDSFFDQNQETQNTHSVLPEALADINNRIQALPGVKMAHLNVNGLKGKLSEIRMFLSNTRLDILAISETI